MFQKSNFNFYAFAVSLFYLQKLTSRQAVTTKHCWG